MIVKNLNFGDEARDEVFKGITKLTQAVSSTLGASGKCVLLEAVSYTHLTLPTTPYV